MSIDQDYSAFLSTFDSQKFQELWPAQEYVLKEYSQTYTNEKDLAIELPTGAGKTLISLLIAEAWRRENKKVAILSANKTLARQMANEAKELGIPFVLMEGRGVDIPSRDRREYRRSVKVAVMNYWVYFNQNPVVDNADLLVMDDAHLAEHCLHSLWSVEIERYKHNNLFKTLITELVNQFPEYTVLQDSLEENPSPITPPELLSFIDQVSISKRIREIIDSSPLLETNSDLRFRWHRLRNSLNEANIYLSTNSIWIRPYIYPLISNTQYAEATQRIYMSATIGDTPDLCRRLGVKKITKIPVPDEFAETTNGRRLIVMNRIEKTDIPERLEYVILSALRKTPKSIWICNSKSIAEKFKKIVPEWLNKNELVGHSTWMLKSLGDEIDEFKKAKQGHLFVAGRFDGMDFQKDECRLVVLTTLPRAINIQEEFMCAYLRDASFMKRRLNQRIIQSLGRCNRHPDDYAIYVLADRRFATHFGLEANRESIPKNIIAEIDMAEDMAEIEIDNLVESVKSFLNGDFVDFDSEFNELLDSVPNSTTPQVSSDTAEDEVLGWTAMFISQNYNIAAQRFEECWNRAFAENSIELCAYYGWCWAKARYLESLQGTPGTFEKSLEIFERSINRGGISAWFNRMRVSLNRVRNQNDKIQVENQEYANAIIYSFDNYLEQLGNRGTRFEKWCNKIFEDLNSESHSKFQSSLKELGAIIGYSSIIPRHQSATDCRWRGIFGNHKEVITFEAKIDKPSDGEIIASDIGQVHNQMARVKSEFELFGYIIRGTIVTQLSKLSSDAESSAGEIRIISKGAIIALWDIIRQIFNEYRNLWSFDDINSRIQAVDRIRPKIPTYGWLIRALDTDKRFISSEVLLNEWKF